MKTELKISTLSIICVLSTVIALPSFGASAVRSLGGAGTYSSASSAATVGEKPTTGTVGSVRAGSLRANAPQSATSSKLSSTRAGATPRLSIGKYLAGSSIIGGAGSSSGSMGNSQAGVNDLKKTVDDLVVDVEGLKEEIASLTGEYPVIEFENGILTIVQDGVSEEIDLNDYFVSEDSLQELEDKINEIVIPDLSEYAKKSELDGLLTSADLSELQSAVDALELVDESMDAAIAALQGGMITADDLNDKVAELKAVDAGLQTQIDNLKNSSPSSDGLVNKEYVDGLVGQLEAADVALQNAIAAIEQPDVDKAYVDAAIAGLNEAIGALQGADSTMEQAIADLQASLEGVATKDEIKDFVNSAEVDAKIQEAVAGLTTDEEIADFVTSGQLQTEIANLATQDQIKDFITSDYVSAAIAGLQTAEDVSQAIENATSGLATKQELADAKSELQAAIDRMNTGQVELTNYYTKAEADEKFATKDEIANFVTSDDVGAQIDSAVEGLLTSDDLLDLENAVSALESADVSMNAAIAALQGGMITADDLNDKVEELKAVDAGLQTQIDNLQNSIPSTEGLVNKDYVDGLVGQLEAADVALQNAIDAIENPDVDKAYVDAAIADLNEAIGALQDADSTMEQAIADLQASLEGAATKDEIKDFVKSAEVDAKIQEAVAGLATEEQIADFVTTGKLQEEIAKLATKEEIANFVTSDAVSNAIVEATKDLLTAEDVADFVKSGDMAQAIADATSGLATKQELADAKSELQAAIERIDAGQVELTNYYTKAEADAKFATKDLGNAQTAGVTKLYGTKGESDDGAMTQKAVTEELNAISETLNNFDLDGVLRSAAAQGSYLINFDNAGNVSYAPIEIIGGDFKMLDLTVDAVVPSTTMSLN